MRSGQTAPSASQSPVIGKSTNYLPKKSFDGPKKILATVERSDKWLLVTFDDGGMTQARDRSEALVMAADYVACIDGQPVDNYFAKWVGRDRICVAVLA